MAPVFKISRKSIIYMAGYEAEHILANLEG